MKTKQLLLLFLLLFFAVTANAQQSINYKAIINDANGNVLANMAITVQFTILLEGTTSVYGETHNPTTDANGIIIVNIGEGSVISGGFNTIDWGNAPHYLKTEIDKGEGLVDMGTTEFKTVPYALHAKIAENVSGEIKETQSLADVAAIDNHVNTQLKNVSDPTDAQDVATKAYVDALKERIYEELLDAGLNGIVKDVDGNTYKTVKIGKQVWMAENLKTTKYSNGIQIPLVTDYASWAALGFNNTDAAYCFHVNDASGHYGALYTYAAAINGTPFIDGISTVPVQGVCPDGWHLPSDAEWTELENYLADNGYNYDGSTGGGTAKIGKSMATASGWASSSNTGAVGNTDYPDYRNKSGFSALPGGYRNIDGTFVPLTMYGRWWSSTEYNSVASFYRNISFLVEYEQRVYFHKKLGMSVRCIKD